MGSNFHSIEDKIEVIVGNAYHIKHTPGRKTDPRNSEWIAELCLKGMINPSRIFPKEDREILLMYSSALRVTEAINVRCSDLNLERREII